MEKLYTVSRNKTGSCLWLRSWTPYCQITLKLRKVGKITRPFRYDLSQIPYNYTVEVTNRFKGLDLIECLKNYGQRFMILCRGTYQDHPQKKKCKKAKLLSEDTLQIAEKRGEAKGKGEKQRYTHLNAELKTSKERQESLPYWSVPRNRGKQ